MDEYRRCQEVTDHQVRLVTVVGDGVTVLIGHRGTTDQIAAAVDAGATLSTHLENGAHHLGHHALCLCSKVLAAAIRKADYVA